VKTFHTGKIQEISMPKAKKAAKKSAKKVVKKATKGAKKSVAKKSVKKVIKKVSKKSVKKPAKKSKKVQAIPKGYHNITPYMIVHNGKAAIAFYQKAFGAKLISCMDKPDGKVGHAEMQIGDSKFMLADECHEMHAHAPEAGKRPAVGIHLYMKDVDAVVERAGAAGAVVTRPIADQFYGDRACGLEDPFGHSWYVATHIEDVTPAKMKKRLEEMAAHSHS
jgi:PhnB protein